MLCCHTSMQTPWFATLPEITVLLADQPLRKSVSYMTLTVNCTLPYWTGEQIQVLGHKKAGEMSLPVCLHRHLTRTALRDPKSLVRRNENLRWGKSLNSHGGEWNHAPHPASGNEHSALEACCWQENGPFWQQPPLLVINYLFGVPLLWVPPKQKLVTDST